MITYLIFILFVKNEEEEEEEEEDITCLYQVSNFKRYSFFLIVFC